MMDPREIPILVRLQDYIYSKLALTVGRNGLFWRQNTFIYFFLKNIEGWNLEPCQMLTPHFNTGGLITIPVGMQASRPNRNYASFK